MLEAALSFQGRALSAAGIPRVPCICCVLRVHVIMAADFNHAFNALWEPVWNTSDPTSNHNHWSVLKAVASKHLGRVQSDGNYAASSLVHQIKANDCVVHLDPSLRLSAYSVPSNVPRCEWQLRALFVEWLLSNSAYFQCHCDMVFCENSEGKVCASVQEYTHLTVQDHQMAFGWELSSSIGQPPCTLVMMRGMLIPLCLCITMCCRSQPWCTATQLL